MTTSSSSSVHIVPAVVFEDADGTLARLVCKVIRENQDKGIPIAVARKVLEALAEEVTTSAKYSSATAVNLTTPPLPEPYQPAGEDAGCWFPDFFVESQMHEFGKEYVRLNLHALTQGKI